MNCQAIAEQLQEKLPLTYVCEPLGADRLRLLTPFLYPDGDYIEFYFQQTPAGTYLTDLGEVLAYLTDSGISLRQSPKRQKTLNNILALHGVERFQGELRIRLEEDGDTNLNWQVSRLAQAAVQTLDMLYTLRLASLVTFQDEVEEYWVERDIPYEAKYPVVGGSGELYAVDYYLPRRRPVLVATLSSATAGYANTLTSKVVRQWHDIRRVDGRYNYLSLLDDSSDVWKPEWIDQVAQLSHVIVWRERDRIEEVLVDTESAESVY